MHRSYSAAEIFPLYKRFPLASSGKLSAEYLPSHINNAGTPVTVEISIQNSARILWINFPSEKLKSVFTKQFFLAFLLDQEKRLCRRVIFAIFVSELAQKYFWLWKSRHLSFRAWFDPSVAQYTAWIPVCVLETSVSIQKWYIFQLKIILANTKPQGTTLEVSVEAFPASVPRKINFVYVSVWKMFSWL